MIQLGVIGADRIGRVHVQNIRAGVDGAAVRTLADPFLTEETDELRSFVSAITRRTPAEVTANDGLQPVRMALAAKRSLLEHRPVLLDEIPE